MGRGNRRYGVCALAAVLAAGTLALASPTPAAAEGIFDFFFGGLHRALEPQRPASAYAEPSAAPYREPGAADTPPRYAGGGPLGLLRAHLRRPLLSGARGGQISAAEMCHAFCPGSETRLYSGSSKIDFAVAADGSRYRDLDHAFLYRQQLVAGCTCNGHDPFGLAHIDVKTDPTLRPGDVVATKAGMVAFTGRGKDKTADFTPVDADRGLSSSYREKLSEMKIMPPNPGARKQTPSVLQSSPRDRDHQAQLAR